MNSDMNKFNYNRLISFIYLAETLNYSTAASKLGKGRATISEHLESFEQELGQPLFDKDTRKLQLTPFGKRIYQHSLLLHKQITAWEQSLSKATDEGQNNTVRIAYTDVLSNETLLKLLRHANELGKTIELVELGPDVAHQLMKQNHIDLIITPSNVLIMDFENEWKVIGTMPYRFYAHKDFFHHWPVDGTDLISNTQILPRVYTDKYDDKKFIFSSNNISITNTDLLQKALSDKFGWAFLPIHIGADKWENIIEIETQLGKEGYITSFVARWRNGERQRVKFILDFMDLHQDDISRVYLTQV